MVAIITLVPKSHDPLSIRPPVYPVVYREQCKALGLPYGVSGFRV